MKRFIKILLTFMVFLIPVAGIWWGTQVLSSSHYTWGFIVGFISGIVLLPCSGILFDAFTNDRTVYIDINKPWKCSFNKPTFKENK